MVSLSSLSFAFLLLLVAQTALSSSAASSAASPRHQSHQDEVAASAAAATTNNNQNHNEVLSRLLRASSSSSNGSEIRRVRELKGMSSSSSSSKSEYCTRKRMDTGTSTYVRHLLERFTSSLHGHISGGACYCVLKDQMRCAHNSYPPVSSTHSPHHSRSLVSLCVQVRRARAQSLRNRRSPRAPRVRAEKEEATGTGRVDSGIRIEMVVPTTVCDAGGATKRSAA